MYVAKGESIDVELWRNINAHKAWYEWAVTAPVVTPVHNPLGRSYFIGL